MNVGTRTDKKYRIYKLTMNHVPSPLDVINITNEESEDIDPIHDIVDYLVRCAKISFKNAQLDEKEFRTSDRIKMACDMYRRSPTDFLIQFGKYLAPYHLSYFENSPENMTNGFRVCVEQLKEYHSDVSRHKRIRNRRFIALQKFKSETDYFSEKQMMYRNPLLYEQLVGQYLTDDEIYERDRADVENPSFLNIVLETVDRNQMRQTKNEQILREGIETDIGMSDQNDEDSNCETTTNKQWGEFEVPDTTPKHKPEKRKQCLITAPERNLLREEFLQEMYSSFMDGRDIDVDYNSIDFDEKYDDLEQLSQDAEDKYFDSDDIGTLEEHMKLVDEYGKRNSKESLAEDPLDEFMRHISNKI